MQSKVHISILSVLGWTAIGVVFALPGLNEEGGWRMALLGSLTSWWSWGLIGLLIAAADQALPLSEKHLTRRLLAHLPLSFILTALYLYVAAGMRAAVGIGSWTAVTHAQLLTNALRGMFLWSWLVYWLILGAWLAKQYYERYLSSELRMERLERLSSEARLHSLRLQLDPHFLFNALNTVSSQVEKDPRLARRMIEHLGDLLRMTLETKDRQEVPLTEELVFLDHYLAIQKIRFGDRLKFETSIAEDVRYALVPALLVQPLVENAIRHGISKRSVGGTVWVSAARAGGRLKIEVADDGVGLPADWCAETSPGLGLSVTRQRVLGLHQNGDSSFAIRPREGRGAVVEIALPLRFNGEVADAHVA